MWSFTDISKGFYALLSKHPFKHLSKHYPTWIDRSQTLESFSRLMFYFKLMYSVFYVSLVFP